MGPFNAGWTEQDVEAVLTRGNPDELLYVPIVVGLNASNADRKWAEDVCLELSAHQHFQVRANAILGLGHIVRNCGEISSDRVFPTIERAFLDMHTAVRAHAQAAAGEVHIHLGIFLRGYDAT